MRQHLFEFLTLRGCEVIIQETDQLQRALFLVCNILRGNGLQVFTSRSKTTAFFGKYRITTKVVVDNKTLEQVYNFKYLGCSVSVSYTHLDVYKRQVLALFSKAL